MTEINYDFASLNFDSRFRVSSLAGAKQGILGREKILQTGSKSGNIKTFDYYFTKTSKIFFFRTHQICR